MQMYDIMSISNQFFHSGFAIALSTKSFLNDQTDFRPQVLWIEIHQICYPYDLFTASVGHDQPELLVCENIAGGIGYIVMKEISRIRHVGAAYLPEIIIVLDTIEQIQILRLHGTEQHERTMERIGWIS